MSRRPRPAFDVNIGPPTPRADRPAPPPPPRPLYLRTPTRAEEHEAFLRYMTSGRDPSWLDTLRDAANARLDRQVLEGDRPRPPKVHETMPDSLGEHLARPQRPMQTTEHTLKVIRDLRTRHPELCLRPNATVSDVCVREFAHRDRCGWDTE